MDTKSWRITLAMVLTLAISDGTAFLNAHPPAAYTVVADAADTLTTHAAGGPAGDIERATSRQGRATLAERIVTKVADTDDGTCDLDCSLREAIAAATPGDTIVFTSTLTGQTLPLNSELVISKTLTIDGSSLDTPIAISGQNAVRVFRITSSGVVTLNALSIISGTVSSEGGGGIFNEGQLTVQGCTLYGNQASYAGGIYNAGTLTVMNSTLSGNQTTYSGGGISNAGRLTVQGSTLSGNSASTHGGGISNGGTLTVTNSTLSGNSANNFGGGIYNAGALTMMNSTLSGNSANTGGGIYNASWLNYENTLIANSVSGGECDSTGGTIGTNAYNLVEDGSCSTNATGFLSGDPQIAPLAPNGTGPSAGSGQAPGTLTHALRPGSPAIDAVPPLSCTVSADQRGFPRPYPAGGACDIGAYEAGPMFLTKTVTPTTDVPYHDLVTYTLVLSNTGEADDPSVWLTDTLPAEVSFDSWIIRPTGATLAGNAIRWHGSLAAGQAITLTFQVRHTGDYKDHVTNLARFSGTTGWGSEQASFDVEACYPTYTVQNAADTGAGSLRQAIASTCPGGHILFSSDFTITLGSELVFAKQLTIDGEGHAVTVSGQNAVRVFNIASSGVVTLSHLHIINGATTNNGGGIYNAGTLTVQDCTLFGNSTQVNWNNRGGGIYNEGALTVQDSTLSGNSINGVYNYGGGIYNQGTLTMTNSTLSGNLAIGTFGSGGGIYNQGTLTMTNSTFSGNQADEGGGIYNANTLMMTNSTLSSNLARSGGGIMSHGDIAQAILTHVTLSRNVADFYGGGISNELSATLYLKNSIVAGNDDSMTPPQYDDCYNSSATLISQGHNLVGSGTGCPSNGTGDLTGDPLLNSLADNGGPGTGSGQAPGTLTHALLPNSPAIDAGNPAGGAAACLPTDQRGEARDDLRCDIGAFELQFSDSDTVIKSGFAGGAPYSFGPTWISMTLSAADPGLVTVTKHLTYPGGVADVGEMPATWWITDTLSDGWPITLSLCYTDAEIAGLFEDSLRAFRWDGLQWTEPISTGLTVDEAANCVTLRGIEQLSAWTLKDVSQGGDPTAVTLRKFSAGVMPARPLLGTLVLLGALALVRRRK